MNELEIEIRAQKVRFRFSVSAPEVSHKHVCSNCKVALRGTMRDDAPVIVCKACGTEYFWDEIVEKNY